MKYTGFSDLIPMPLRKLLFAVPAAMLPDRGERTLTGRMRRTLRTAASPSEKRYLDIISRFNEQLKNEVYGARFADMSLLPSYEVISSVYDATSARKRVEKIMETDIQTYLPGDILTKVDIASMACSLEVRSPFMDHEVVEFAASLPLKYKQAGMSRKHILKEAFKDIIPTEIRDRRKKGFGVPIASWFRDPWQGILKEHLLSGILVKQNFFKKQAFEQLINNHCSGQADNSYPLWSLLILELFMQNDLEK
jgi:asparagine synthase (glutamine-hydrolysing)